LDEKFTERGKIKTRGSKKDGTEKKEGKRRHKNGGGGTRSFYSYGKKGRRSQTQVERKQPSQREKISEKIKGHPFVETETQTLA